MARTRRARSIGCVAALLGVCLMVAPGRAQAPKEDDRSATAPKGRDELPVESTGSKRIPEGKDPGLDALLQLPSGFMTNHPDAVAGAGESEWRRRFTKAEAELAEARASLEATKRELDSVAGEGGSSQWSIAPPGGSSGAGGESSPATSPLSFKLRQQLREDRERIEAREKALRELRIQADLAGVPQSWRTAKSSAAAGAAPERD